jgi:hypothetical protein
MALVGLGGACERLLRTSLRTTIQRWGGMAKFGFTKPTTYYSLTKLFTYHTEVVRIPG